MKLRKLSNWDDDGYNKMPSLPPGDYVCKIMDIKPGRSKEGFDMLVVEIDIAEGRYKDYFMNKFRYNSHYTSEPKWGCKLNRNYHESYRNAFRTFITQIEESNPGYEWDFDTDSLKQKLIGCNFVMKPFRGDDGKMHEAARVKYALSVPELRARN